MPQLVSVAKMVADVVKQVVAQRPYVAVEATHARAVSSNEVAIWLGAAAPINKLQEYLLLQVFDVTPQAVIDADGEVVDGRRANIKPRPAKAGPADNVKMSLPGYTWYWLMPATSLSDEMKAKIGAEAVRICTDYRSILMEQLMEEMTAPEAPEAPAPAPVPAVTAAPEAVVTAPAPAPAPAVAGQGVAILG